MRTVKPNMKKAVLLNGLSSVQKPTDMQHFHLPKSALGILGLLLLLGIGFGTYTYLGQGDPDIAKQRLFGQVALSDGIYPARNLHDLNELSWENGLDILSALDSANTSIQLIENAETHPEIRGSKLAEAHANLNQSMSRLHVLLRDRETLLKSARLLRARDLFTPVYQEYLRDTLTKYSALKQPQSTSEKLVQQ